MLILAAGSNLSAITPKQHAGKFLHVTLSAKVSFHKKKADSSIHFDDHISFSLKKQGKTQPRFSPCHPPAQFWGVQEQKCN